MDELNLWLYAGLVAVLQEGFFFLVLTKYLKCRSGKGYGLALLYTLMTGNDFFWSYTSIVGGNFPLYFTWVFLVYILAYLILRYCFVGNLFDNFIHLFSMEFILMLIAMLITFPFYVIECGGDMEKIGLFMNTPSLANLILFILQFTVFTFLLDKLWGWLYKLKGKGFRIICIVFAFFDLAVNAFYGWRGVQFVTIVYALGILYILGRQNREDKYLDEQYAYYRALEEAQRQESKEIAEIRHDIANHLSVMEELERDESGREILRTIDKNRGVYTGIPVLDCLITEKEKICADKGIAFTKNLESIAGCSISEYDLVSLFANLLDNAIEAAEKTKQPMLSMQLEEKQGYLKAVITNSKPDESQPIETAFKSTKSDKKKHGIGTQVIRRLVDKNDGRIQYTDKGNSMEASLFLNMQ